MAAVEHVESHFVPLAIQNSMRHIVLFPSSISRAAEQARECISDGDSVDPGLMQINSHNVVPLGMTIEAALDPYRALQAAI